MAIRRREGGLLGEMGGILVRKVTSENEFKKLKAVKVQGV